MDEARRTQEPSRSETPRPLILVVAPLGGATAGRRTRHDVQPLSHERSGKCRHAQHGENGLAVRGPGHHERSGKCRHALFESADHVLAAREATNDPARMIREAPPPGLTTICCPTLHMSEIRMIREAPPPGLTAPADR